MAAVSRSGSGVVSRSGSAYPVSRGKSGPPSYCSCNKCRKTLSTTVYICACDCVFCEECTFNHFNANSNCPCCNRTLNSNDFLEVVVADPSTISNETLKNSFQKLFTKFSSAAKAMTYGEMSTRILASYDDGRRNTRFLLKQLVGESKKAVEHSAHANRLCSQQQQEITQLKQAMSSMRIKYDQSIADLQHRLQASLGGIQELQHQNAALKKQTHQFRELYAGGGVPGTGSTSRVPGSSHSSNSGGGQHGLGTERLTGSPYAPPMPGYVRNKQELERAKERENEERSRSHGPLLRGEREGASRLSSSDLDSVITPIVVPPPHHHIASNNGSHHRHRITSPRRDTMVGNVPQSPRVRDVGNIPQSPRVRDLSGGSGYMFTSRSSNNSRDLQSSGIKRHRPESTSVSPGYQNSFSFSSRGNASIPSSSPFGRR